MSEEKVDGFTVDWDWANAPTRVNPADSDKQVRPTWLQKSRRPGSRFDGRTMPWGKYQGRPLEDVPIGYIGWLFERQLSGETAIPEDLARALFAAFMLQLEKLPVYAKALRSLLDAIRPEHRPKGRPITLDETEEV